MARSRMGLALGAAVLGAALLATACGRDNASSGATQQKGGIATYAEEPGAFPNWIFPFIDPADNDGDNLSQFQYLMYRPLYWQGNGNSPDLDYDLSLANAPTYTGNKVVVNLKNYVWSNGEKLSPADVEFFMNMLFAEKANFAQYVPGEFPDNVTSVQTTGAEQVTFTLNDSYSPAWFTGNELLQITPMPQAWDKTSDSAAAGSGGCATEELRCAAVYNYLLAKNKQESGYATDPLWQVVDGPWKLKSFTNQGAADFVPNPEYSGPDKPKLDEFDEVPFTTPEAEYNAIRSGKTINVGEIPPSDLPKRDASSTNRLPPTNPLGSSNYNMILDPVWGWSYGLINYGNPAAGPAFKQLYVRQALQETIDQVTDSDIATRGYAVPSTGPVPNLPATEYLADNQKSNNGQGPYPFNIAKAKSTLTSHGWTEQNGVMTCGDPGTGNNQCGAGITEGTQLNLRLEYRNESTAASEEVQQWKSDASQAGIRLQLNSQPFNTVITDVTTCPTSPSTCGWQLAYVGYQSFETVPTGDALFLPGSTVNYSGVNDPKMTSLVNATLHDSGRGTFLSYESYAAAQLPGAFNFPDAYKVYAVSANLGGVSINPLQSFNPEDWYFTK